MLLKNKIGLVISIGVMLLIGHISNAQEKESKTQLTEETVEEIEIIEIESDEKPSNVPIHVIESVPYPIECKHTKTNEERKTCVTGFIKKHIVRKFNTDLAEELSLESGRKRIWVRFKIDKTGKVVDVSARGPHPKLEEEAIRVVKLLPEFTPGKHNGEAVSMPYMMPIVFSIPEPIKKDGKQ
jgi:protein TonB